MRGPFDSGRTAELVAISLLALASCVSSFSSCSKPVQPQLAPAQLKGANVLLITIDTLRADRLGSYGNRNGLTPALDGLARTGLRYAHARAHVPMTLPSHASILTGLTPQRSGVHNNTTFRLNERVPTLATFLKRAGYRTGAFVGAFVLDARFGLARDFDVYDDRLPHSGAASFHFAERRAREVVDAALAWIAPGTQHPAPAPGTQHPAPAPAPSTQHPAPAPSTQHPAPGTRDRPWLAWIHLFDPHAPYDAPAGYRAGRSAYDAEVAYTDAMIGALVDRLRAAGQLDHTLIVVTSDHGESLGEHGETTHGLFAYESTLAVPLILNAPAIGAGVVDAPVAHMDIVPTILDLVGAPVPQDLDGRSLVQTPAPDRPLYFEALDAYLTRGWAPLRGIVQNGWKYIDVPDAELYDLGSDPAEQRNRIGQDARADSMRTALTGIEEQRAPAPLPTALDADAAARLRSLGYTGGSRASAVAQGFGPADLRGFSRADDPKHLVALNERFNSALTAFDEGRSTDAVAGFLDVLSARPDFLTARTSAATALIGMDRAGEAVRLLREAPAEQRRAPELLARLGNALHKAGDLTSAATVLEQARQGGGQNVDVLQDLAVVYAQLGRTDAARSLFQELTTANPTAATGWYNLGLFELQSRRPSAAAAALRKAVDRDPSYGDAWNALGAALATTDPDGAKDAWQHAEHLLPHDYDLLFNLGMLTAQSDRPAEAVPYLRRFLDEAPRDRYARDLPRVQQTLARIASREP